MWTYVNVYDGVVMDHDTEETDDPDWGSWGIEYEVLVQTNRFIAVQWLLGDSLHIWIHKDLLA